MSGVDVPGVVARFVGRARREREADLISAQAERIRQLEDQLEAARAVPAARPAKDMRHAIDRLESALRVGHPQGREAIDDLVARIERATGFAGALYELSYREKCAAEAVGRLGDARERVAAAMAAAKPGGAR